MRGTRGLSHFGRPARHSLLVMPGLDPGIPLERAMFVPKRDGRDKPGHDGGETIGLFLLSARSRTTYRALSQIHNISTSIEITLDAAISFQ
jgi:hypothetical protein